MRQKYIHTHRRNNAIEYDNHIPDRKMRKSLNPEISDSKRFSFVPDASPVYRSSDALH